MSAMTPQDDSTREVIRKAFQEVDQTVARLADTYGVQAPDLQRRAYELFWKGPLTKEQYEHINALAQSSQLLLGMSRPPKASVLANYVSHAKELDKQLVDLLARPKQ